jgi:hypothetical protein
MRFSNGSVRHPNTGNPSTLILKVALDALAIIHPEAQPRNLA